MCGRYTLSSPGDTIAELFGIDQLPPLEARFNIAPTQEALVVRGGVVGAPPSAALLRWGLIPAWADSPQVGSRMINARAESAATKPAYRDSLSFQRCLVPADGFYEWQRAGNVRQPYLIRRQDRAPFAFAGLWARWHAAESDPGLDSFTILTVPPNELVARLHDRMPLVLPPTAFAAWLDRRTNRPQDLQPLLATPSADGWEMVPVSRAVNDVRHDDADCIAPLTEPA
jgi:putative SOS response-associated peptidase YedK